MKGVNQSENEVNKNEPSKLVNLLDLNFPKMCSSISQLLIVNY